MSSSVTDFRVDLGFLVRDEFGCETSQFATSFVRLPGSDFRL